MISLCSLRATLLACAGFLASLPFASAAAELSITPLQVHLNRTQAIQHWTLENHESQAMSFEVVVKQWRQGADGSWQLIPSDDLVVTPLIVTVPAKGKAQVRVGTLAPSVESEHAYRVELQQLPTSDDAGAGARIKLLTRFSLPVFVQLDEPETAAALAAPVVTATSLGATLRNTGTRYLRRQEGQLRALDAAGRVLQQDPLQIEYVLAGAQLPLLRPLAPGACAQVARIELMLHEPDTTLAIALAPDARQCGH